MAGEMRWSYVFSMEPEMQLAMARSKVEVTLDKASRSIFCWISTIFVRIFMRMVVVVVMVMAMAMAVVTGIWKGFQHGWR